MVVMVQVQDKIVIILNVIMVVNLKEGEKNIQIDNGDLRFCIRFSHCDILMNYLMY